MQKAFNFKPSLVYMLIKYLHDKARMYKRGKAENKTLRAPISAPF